MNGTTGKECGLVCGDRCDCATCDRNACHCGPKCECGCSACDAARQSPRTLLIAAMAVLSLIVAGGRVMAAQSPAGNPGRDALAFSVMQIRPVGALGDNIGLGYGIAGAYLHSLDGRGVVSLRVDLSGADYGNVTRRTAFSESVGNLVDVDVRTANTLAQGTIGLQLTLTVGPLLPYMHAGIGAQAFYTETGVYPTGGGYVLASTINQFDMAPAAMIGGGLYVPFAVARLRFLLDIGAQYVRGGTAQYLGARSIVDLPDGGVAIAAMESTTDIVSLRIGARVSL